jgi:hypothetical protein
MLTHFFVLFPRNAFLSAATKDARWDYIKSNNIHMLSRYTYLLTH